MIALFLWVTLGCWPGCCWATTSAASSVPKKRARYGATLARLEAESKARDANYRALLAEVEAIRTMGTTGRRAGRA